MNHARDRIAINLLLQIKSFTRRIQNLAEQNLTDELCKFRNQHHFPQKAETLTSKSHPSLKKNIKSGQKCAETNLESVSSLDWNGEIQPIWDIPTLGEKPEDLNLRPWLKGFRNLWTAFHETGAFQHPLSQKIIWFLKENQAEPLIISGKTLTVTKINVLFDKMQNFGCEAETAALNTFLHVLCKSYETDQAEAILRLVKFNIKPNEISFVVLINGWCREGKIGRAKDVFKWMSSHDCVNVAACNFLVDGMSRRKDFSGAARVLKDMSKYDCKPNIITYNILIFWFCKARKVQMALKVYNSMLQQGLVEPNEATYGSLIHSLCSIGDVEYAWHLFDKMRSAGLSPRVAMYNDFIRYYTKKRQVETAWNLLIDMKERGMVNRESYELLMKRLCVQNRLDKACVLWVELRSGGWNGGAEVYMFLIRAFCCRRELQGAFSLLKEMIGQSFVPDRHTLDMFCAKCRKDGEMGRLDQLKDMMMRANIHFEIT